MAKCTNISSHPTVVYIKINNYRKKWVNLGLKLEVNLDSFFFIKNENFCVS